MSPLTYFAALCLAPLAFAQAPRFPDERQILWQRELGDALELSAALQRPLLIAINADGESASELIVRERYRDPRWVAHTRSFVCVVASYFRHEPRDHADDGVRQPCPRFGEVTCAEHMALEPATHARFLAGTRIELFGEVTDRISPRHVLVSPQGEVLFDRYLLFDLGELDVELERWAARFPATPAAPVRAWSVGSPFDVRARARLATEDALALGGVPALRALNEAQPAVRGAVEWLWRLSPVLSEQGLAPKVFALCAPSAELPAASAWLREQLVGLDGQRGHFAGAFGQLSASRAADRTLYRSFVAAGSTQERVAAFDLLGAIENEAVAQSVRDNGVGNGAFSFESFEHELEHAQVEPTRAVRERAALRASEELERELAELGPQLALERDNSALRRRVGSALLGLARQRLAAGIAGADLLLEDAREHLAWASTADPLDVELLLERARIANLLGRFEEQERVALAALDVRRGARDDGFHVGNSESLRWLGDACARQLAARSGAAALVEISGLARGFAAFALAARAPDADASDWLSLASFCGAVGRARERERFAFEGLRRFPASQELWSELAAACDARGRPERYVEYAEQLARDCAQWPEPQWYAGQARVLLAQWARRGEDADGAVADYERAQQHFARALELAPHFKDSCEHYLAMCAFGRGFAHLLAERREAAAQCVVEAAAVRPQAATQRDGLERYPVDLIDAVLEQRASGASPVDSQAWLAQLETANPGNAFWANSIADALLREAIRAYERGRLELGDRHCERGAQAARRARAVAPGPEADQALAQVLTVYAERIARHGGEQEAAARALTEAAQVFALSVPDGSDGEAWRALREQLRARLGPARPVFRAGR